MPTCVYVLTRVPAALSVPFCLTWCLTAFRFVRRVRGCPVNRGVVSRMTPVCLSAFFLYLFIYLAKWNNWIDLRVADVIQLPAQGQVCKLYMSKSHTISHRNKG